MIDSDLLRHVRESAKLLALEDGPLKQRLIDAAHEFSISLTQPSRWPAGLLEAAQELDADLKRSGKYCTTIETASGATVRNMAERLFDLALKCEVAVGIDMRENA